MPTRGGGAGPAPGRGPGGRGGGTCRRGVGEPGRHRDGHAGAGGRGAAPLRMRALINPRVRPAAVTAPSADAWEFHRALPGYAPTPLHELGGSSVKDESSRLGLPAFKILGASWAVERALREQPGIHTLVAASAGNHGRAVAHVAAQRRLACRVYLPARALPARREAIAA